MDYKFRGKRKDNGQWVFGFYISSPALPFNDSKCFIVEFVGLESGEPIFDWHEVVPETVGMWTGVIRKTIEVYEGDVVNDSISNYLVVWDVREAKFILQFIYDEPVEGICQTSKAMPIDGFMLTVIGNKVDHPHLVNPVSKGRRIK